MAALRYLVLTAARTRTPLAAARRLAVRRDRRLRLPAQRGRLDLGADRAVTCVLAAWLAGAVLAGEPRAQADMTTAAVGGLRGRGRLDVVLVAAVATVLAVLFVGYPLLSTALGRAHVFDRAPRPGDVIAALLAQLACGALGAALAVLFAPPRLVRRASAIAAVLATLLALVPASTALGAAGGPVAVADALADDRRGAEALACLSCLVLAAVALALARRWARRG